MKTRLLILLRQLPTQTPGTPVAIGHLQVSRTQQTSVFPNLR